MPRTRGKKRKFVQELIDVDDDFNGYEDQHEQHQHSQISIGDSLEQEDEELSIDTEQMSKIYERLKEPDVWPQDFSNHIKQRHSEVVEMLEDARHRSLSDRNIFEQAFLPLDRSALADLVTNNETAAIEPTKPILVNSLGPEGQSFCNRLIELFRESDHLIVAYHQVTERARPQNTLQDMDAALKEDKEIALNLLRACKAVVKSDVGRLMTDHSEEGNVRDDDLTSEEERQARSLLLRGINDQIPAPNSIGWKTVARNTEKAVGKLCLAAQASTTNTRKEETRG